MKYLIISTTELDGHAGGTAIICDQVNVKNDYLRDFIIQTGTPENKITKRSGENNSEAWFGEWECGQWSLIIIPFRTYSSIVNKEYGIRTG